MLAWANTANDVGILLLSFNNAIKGNLIWDHGKQMWLCISRGFVELRDRKICWDRKSVAVPVLWNLWKSHLPNHAVSILFKSLSHTCIKRLWLYSHDVLQSQCLASWTRAYVIWVIFESILNQSWLFLCIWNLSF